MAFLTKCIVILVLFVPLILRSNINLIAQIIVFLCTGFIKINWFFECIVLNVKKKLHRQIFVYVCVNLLLLLPNNDLLQQFEDYVIELRCEKGRRKEKKTISETF